MLKNPKLPELINTGHIQQLFKDFRKINAMIIGDVMVDSYLYGDVERISPEAPVPVVNLKKRVNMLGGAANVALNIKALGANPLLFSVCGDDIKGREFADLLLRENIATQNILTGKDRITTTKFRILGNKSQMLRVDEEITEDLSTTLENKLLANIIHTIGNQEVHVIIFQDYNKGVITKKVIKTVCQIAADHNIPVAVDPKRKNFETYQRVRLFKPNLKELREGMKSDFASENEEALFRSIAAWQERSQHDIIMVTLGDQGIVTRYKTDNGYRFHKQPAQLRSIADVSGAGDTVISIASLCAALDSDPQLMAFLANTAGGIVCEYSGVVPVDKSRLIGEINKLAGKDLF